MSVCFWAGVGVRQWCSFVSIRSEWPSPIWTSALWSDGRDLCRMLQIMLCVPTVLGFSRKILQRPTRGWSFSQSLSSADSGQRCGLQAFHVYVMGWGHSVLELPGTFLWDIFFLGWHLSTDGQVLWCWATSFPEAANYEVILKRPQVFIEGNMRVKSGF